MRQRIVWVAELIRPEGAGDLARQALGDAVIAFRRIRRRVGGGDDDFGAIGGCPRIRLFLP